ncbi:MAG: ABC transporter permease subunit [Geminicoccaceae bacterium]|nr:MAG: ABC transporter permease subunit [Geminicoccaceae bacterium]
MPPFAVWPPLTLAVLVVPVVGGLIGTVLPAFGYLPALGLTTLSLEGWRGLALVPGLAWSVLLSVWVALASTLISFCLALAFVAATTTAPRTAWLRRLVSPVLAAPHVGVAIGLAFLLAPSGLFVRLLSPWLTGFTQPPAWLVPGDPWGLSLLFGLVVKETPFLVLMLLAAQAGLDAERRVLVARSLGYGPLRAWHQTVLPAVYPSLRWPIMAVLAYGFSPVDMALVLGPSVPPILAVRVVELMGDPSLARWPIGAAAALLLLALAVLTMALWRLAERPVSAVALARARRGPGATSPLPWRGLALVLPTAVTLTALLGLAAMALWSIAGRWRFPDPWPDTLRLDGWQQLQGPLGHSLFVTAGLAAIVAGTALVLTILCLEAETYRRRPLPRRVLFWLFLPLVVPQAAFLFGVQVVLVGVRLDGTLGGVALVQLAFVLPYTFLALAGSWRGLDPRWRLTAASLGQGPWRVLWRVKLPLLAAPIATAFAIGFAVSVALYLPTLFAGGGRVRTLALEAVALAGADRRSAGVVVTLLALLPLLGFLFAAAVRLRVERR